LTALVIDASVAVKWVVEEEGSEEAAALAHQDLVAPELIHPECANVLWAKTRRGELAGQEAPERLHLLLKAPLRLVPTREVLDLALELALELEHPVYDCVYLALALARETSLVTADDRFVRAVSSHRRYRRSIRPLVAT
jgi:predicted nucleic acid-binding protein